MIFKLTILGMFAYQYMNVPYRWAGNSFAGMDCSGLANKVLKDVGILYQYEDYSAQGLQEELKTRGYRSGLGPDSLLFFGHSLYDGITHVAIAIDEHWMIHASGGDRTTLSLETAIEQDARVKISPIASRKDLLSSIKIDYSDYIDKYGFNQ